MKKPIVYLLAALLALLPLTSLALELAEPLTGTCCYPEGSNETTATYVYRYAYPQIAGDSDVAIMIDDTYAYEADYIETFTLPVNGDMYGEGEDQYYTNMSYQVTCNDDAWFSVYFTTLEHVDESTVTRVSAHVFALTGNDAGSVTSLPVVLGVLDPDENDEWLEERQTARCDTLVRGLIWEQLQAQAEAGAVTLYDDADREYFDGMFYPEEDFYMDADGSLVFFLQEDTMAPAEYGVLTYRFTIEDLLDEL